MRYEPTEEEIEEALKEIRAGWTEAIERKRLVGNEDQEPYTIPVVSIANMPKFLQMRIISVNKTENGYAGGG